MIDSAVDTHLDDELLSEHRSLWDGLPILLLSAAIIGAVIVGTAVWWVIRPDVPGDDSAEAGFARDMSFHHAQAVEMAVVIRDTTENDDIRVLATDIMLTQQAQIGMMSGWLQVWNLSLNSDDAPMAWADMSGHDMAMNDGVMVGMASADDIRALREMTGDEADREFLRLMIAHHQGGIMMANAALDASVNADVAALAESIANGQQTEIDLMEWLLADIDSTR